MCHKTNSSKRTSQCLILTAGTAVEQAQATPRSCVILTQRAHAGCLGVLDDFFTRLWYGIGMFLLLHELAREGLCSCALLHYKSARACADGRCCCKYHTVQLTAYHYSPLYLSIANSLGTALACT